MAETRSTSDWKMLYAAAMRESEGAQLRRRIREADIVIRTRLEELPKASGDRLEKMELQSALDYLGLLKASLNAAA